MTRNIIAGFASAVKLEGSDDTDVQVEGKETLQGKKKKSTFKDGVLPGKFSLNVYSCLMP